MSVIIQRIIDNICIAECVTSISTPRKLGIIRASEVGHPCTRKLQYLFHNPLPSLFSGKNYMVMESGVMGEDLFVKRVKEYAPEFLIRDRQKEVKSEDGVLIGHIDGILECPNGDVFVWEHKVTGEDKFNKAAKGISLLSFDEQYYMQALVYMHLTGIHQHLTTVELSGGRDYAEIMTRYDENHIELLLNKIKSIQSDVMMPPLVKWQQNIYCKNSKSKCQFYERCFEA